MKALFFLLLFVNVAFAIYIHFEPGSASIAQSRPELYPEKIKLLSAPAPAPAPVACLEWRNFSGADLQRAEAAIAKLQLGDKLSQHVAGEVSAYWVHIPPLKTKHDATKKIDELKRLGINSYFLIQDDSKWHNAVSMGIFRSEETARKFLAELSSKGVRSAAIGERSLKQTTFVIHEPAEDIIEKMLNLKQEFPGSELKATGCEALMPPH